MSDLSVQPAASSTAALSQIERLVDTFIAPSKTFTDIKNGNRSWWLPFIIGIVVSYGLYAAIATKITWPQVVENAIHFNPKAEASLANADPARAQQTKSMMLNSMKYGMLASPVISLISALVLTLGLWGTINFAFGGKATFGGMLSVAMYATLPRVIQVLLGIIVIYASGAPESFNINSFAPTSVASFLNPTEVNGALYALAGWIDVTTIWTAILLGMGAAIVAGVKRSSGYAAVFSWIAFFIIVNVGWHALMG